MGRKDTVEETHQIGLLILFRIPTINFKVLDLFLLRRRCGRRLERSIGGERTSQSRLELIQKALDAWRRIQAKHEHSYEMMGSLRPRRTNPLLLGLEILRDNML